MVVAVEKTSFPRNNNHKTINKGSRLPQKGKDTCYGCDMTRHWGRTCRTAKHMVDLYQASIKGKGKNAEANYVNEENASGASLDDFDLFMDNV